MKPTDAEFRRAELRQGPGRSVTGVAVRYGDLAQLPWGEERIEAGAFAPLGDVVLNSFHDRTTPLARTGGAGLTLDDTAERLAISAELPPTQAADDVLALVRAGIMRGLSIEFRAVAERMEGAVRVIERAVLSGIGVVDTPAYPASEVEARRRGERRSWVRGGIRYGVESFCECLGGDCSRVLFRPKALGPADGGDVLALTGRASEAVGSTRGGTLRLRNTDEALEWELDRAGRDTAAGQTLRDLSAAKVPVYGRPLIDDDASTFTEAGAVRTYSKAIVRALLLKPIAGDKARRDGWDPITIDGETVKRRARVWL